MPAPENPPKLQLTSAQRYMLSLLNQDGKLLLQGGFRLVRTNGSSAGFKTSANALVFRGLGRYSSEDGNLYATPAGREFFALD